MIEFFLKDWDWFYNLSQIDNKRQLVTDQASKKREYLLNNYFTNLSALWQIELHIPCAKSQFATEQKRLWNIFGVAVALHWDKRRQKSWGFTRFPNDDSQKTCELQKRPQHPVPSAWNDNYYRRVRILCSLNYERGIMKAPRFRVVSGQCELRFRFVAKPREFVIHH